MKYRRAEPWKWIGGLCLLIVVSVLVSLAAAQNAGPAKVPVVGSRAEWLPAKEILVHTPGEELFLGVVHPAAALFERAFSLQDAAREHRNYIKLLEKEGATVHTVVGTLLDGTVDQAGNPLPGPALDELREFAGTFLTVDASALSPALQQEQADYKRRTLAALHPAELVQIILLQPTVRLRQTEINTGFAATYELAPVMNLYFCRDQMITTARGVVVGRMNSPQRAVETRIMKFVLHKLGIQPIFEVTGEARLEGGDFLPAGDTALIGQGLRTNATAIAQLLENKVFGVPRVVVVKDSWKNQDEMHLDTYFNLIGPRLAVIEEKRIGQNGKPAERQSVVDVYQLAGNAYKKIAVDVDFVKYLKGKLGFTLIPVSSDDQLRYGVNFLTIRANRLLAIDGVGAPYKAMLKNAGADATWMDFHNLTGGYGAAHCSTQVLRRE